MSLVDISKVEEQAKKEIAEENSKVAVNKLKELFRSREKAALVVKNLDREIAAYKADVAEALIYESAGVEAK